MSYIHTVSIVCVQLIYMGHNRKLAGDYNILYIHSTEQLFSPVGAVDNSLDDLWLNPSILEIHQS